jgi:5-methylcytosine-specific restriction endonuclease McrA
MRYELVITLAALIPLWYHLNALQCIIAQQEAIVVRAHVAQYGSVRILRGYCPDCKRTAFILDNKFQCCDLPVKRVILEAETNVITLPSKRRRFSRKAKLIALVSQLDQCLYCDRSFSLDNLPVFDHFRPHSFVNDVSVYNCAAACGVCNTLKGSRVFNTIQEARKYVQEEIARRRLSHLWR